MRYQMFCDACKNGPACENCQRLDARLDQEMKQEIYKCSDCGKVIEDGEGHYNYPRVRCSACGDRLSLEGFTHYGEQL